MHDRREAFHLFGGRERASLSQPQDLVLTVQEGLHHPPDRFDEKNHNRQGVIDLVRDAGNDCPEGGELFGVRRGGATILRLAPLTRPKHDTIQKSDVSREVEVLRNAGVVRSGRDGSERIAFAAGDDTEGRVAYRAADAHHSVARGLVGDDDVDGVAATMLVKDA